MSSIAEPSTRLSVKQVPIDQVVPYDRNPRHNASSIEKVAESIRRFGWRQPIVVDGEMVVVVGHTRLEAARRLGLGRVPVHVAEDLTPDQARAYRLADNKVGEGSRWDEELLAFELQALEQIGIDLTPLGFSAAHLPQVNEAAVPEPPADPVTAPGDLIMLGEHRLICGSAAEPAIWVALLEGSVLDLLWTDPPYGVNYAEKNRDMNVARGNRPTGQRSRLEDHIANDELTGGALREFLRLTLGLAAERSRSGAPWYVAGPAGPQQLEFMAVLVDLGIWRQSLIWAKSAQVMGRSDYHYRHEQLFYGWKPGARHTWRGGRSEDSVFECPRPQSSDLHPTMKPVELIARALENSSTPGALVGDPFAGSGSTLIAAEQAGRRAALIELDPGYCDVIVGRWERLTGQKAHRP